MKAKHYISTMLIALVFAFANIQAQTARRPMAKEKEQETRVERTRKASSPQVRQQHSRSAQPARRVQSQQNYQRKATAPARKVQTQQNYQRKATAPARKVQNQQAYHRRTSAPVRTVNTKEVRHKQAIQTKTVKPDRRAANMSTAKHRQTTYRKPNNRHYATPRYSAPKHTVKYHNRYYYGGHHYHYAYPVSKVKIHYHYDTYHHHYNVLYYPAYTNIYWNRHMYRNYRKWYPDYYWNYNYGHRIQTLSVFETKYNLGEVAMVYGRVYATWHNKETDDYLLFFGGDFPYQQFTVVLPGYIARKYSWKPHRFFLGEHITITGLITTFDGSPEIVVKNKRQISLY